MKTLNEAVKFKSYCYGSFAYCPADLVQFMAFIEPETKKTWVIIFIVRGRKLHPHKVDSFWAK